MISGVLDRHPEVRALFDNGWLSLHVMDAEGRIAARFDQGILDREGSSRVVVRPGRMTAGPYAGRSAVLATMHGKEAAFAPVLADRLGLDLIVPGGIDTDALGTFTGEIARQGSIGETARAKAVLGLSIAGGDLALASEGAYGPHPQIPLIPLGWRPSPGSILGSA